MVRKTLLVIAVSIPLALAACGDDDSDTSGDTSADTQSGSTTEDTTSSGGGAAITISETEYQLDPADATAEAGEVTIEATNDGTIVHNLEIEGNGVEEEIGNIEPGAGGEVTVDLEPGTYEIYCPIADHQDQGMEGELTVE